MNIRKHNQNIAAFDKRLVLHDAFNESLELIEERMEQVQDGRVPEALGIMAPSGFGKTEMAKYLRRKCPPFVQSLPEGDVLVAPVVFASLPPTRSIMEIIENIMSDLGAELASKGISKSTNSLVAALKTAQTSVLIIDEIHQLAGRGGSSITTLRNWIKRLIDRTKILVVLLGTAEALEVLKGEEFDRRVTPKKLFKPFRFPTSIEDVLVSILSALTDLLSQDVGMDLLSDLPVILSQRFWVASGGLIAGILSLIKSAATIAFKDDRQAITLCDLAAAYAKAPPGACFAKASGLNPFEMMPDQLAAIAKSEEYLWK